MKLIEGKKIAEKILQDLQNTIVLENLKPGLGVILVGQDEASKIYVDLKEKAAQNIGIKIDVIRMSEHVSTGEVLDRINNLNNDPEIHGIIVQLPLPEHLDRNEIIQAIDPKKDVDGFTRENIDLFFQEHERFFPVFPRAIMELIRHSGLDLEDKNAVIICNSQEFGRTMQVALAKMNILSQYFFREDIKDNLDKIKNADIVITACGEPNLIIGSMIKEGAVIIDGGITRVNEKVVGDVDIESFENKDAYVSPVPGGVGPVTIACLLKNVIEAEKQA